jgi:hypothetical protein
VYVAQYVGRPRTWSASAGHPQPVSTSRGSSPVPGLLLPRVETTRRGICVPLLAWHGIAPTPAGGSDTDRRSPRPLRSRTTVSSPTERLAGFLEMRRQERRVSPGRTGRMPGHRRARSSRPGCARLPSGNDEGVARGPSSCPAAADDDPAAGGCLITSQPASRCYRSASSTSRRRRRVRRSADSLLLLALCAC